MSYESRTRTPATLAGWILLHSRTHTCDTALKITVAITPIRVEVGPNDPKK